MNFISTQAFILDTRDMNESDVIVDFLDDTGTRFKGMAKHGRRSRHRFVNVFNPLSLVRLRYVQRRACIWLQEGKLERCYLTGNESTLSNGCKHIVREVLLGLLPEGDSHPQCFELVLGALIELDKSRYSAINAVNIFLIRYAALMGYLPAFDRCDVCGASLSLAYRWVWQIAPFRTTCAVHFLTGTLKWEWDREVLKLLQIIPSLPAERLWNLHISAPKSPVLFRNLCTWFEILLQRELKSYRWVINTLTKDEKGQKEMIK